MAATTTLLGLVTPTQGTLSGTWGDTVNYGITDYVDIAIAGTLSFAGDGAITLANTTGSSSGNAITSTTAQYMVIRITGTQTVTKVITGPSYSKLYMVDHAGATSAVTFKAAGQSGVSVAVGEKCFVYYNGTDYVKVASSVVATGTVTSVALSGGTTGLTVTGSPITTSGTITLAGTLAPANGGTGVSNNAASTITISGNFASTFTVSGAYTYTFPGQTSSLGYLNIPQSGSAKTTSYSLATTDIGKVIEVGTGGSITVPDATFAAGDAIIIFNNTSGAITMTMTITNAYIAGTDADKATISVATRGVANILFVTGTTCVVTGNVS